MSGTRRAPIFGAAVTTAVAFAILVALGVWQLHRLQWKQDLLAQIDAAQAAAPRPLGDGTPALFTRVEAHGVLRGAPYALYGAEVQGDRLGAQLVEVLDRKGEPPVLVVLGWVDTDHGKPPAVTGARDVTGYVRLPVEPTIFSPADDAAGLRFYTLNPEKIGRALGMPAVAPYTLIALSRVGAPVPAVDLPRPVNNHLQYALTWFGLAASLLAVFGAWISKREKPDD